MTDEERRDMFAAGAIGAATTLYVGNARTTTLFGNKDLHKCIAQEAYRIADAMMKEREYEP